MKKILRQTLLFEEKRATKWFLWMFYIVYLGYGITYYLIVPQIPWNINNSPSSIGPNNIMIYIVMLGLLPFAVYLMKIQKPTPIKYVYFITFTVLNTINDIWLYWGSETSFSSGNIVEIVVVLFSPLFINKRFFNTVFFGTVFKFIVVGLVLQDIIVLFPLFMVVVIAVIASLLLYRFLASSLFSMGAEGSLGGFIRRGGHDSMGSVSQYPLILASWLVNHARRGSVSNRLRFYLLVMLPTSNSEEPVFKLCRCCKTFL